MAQDLHKAMHFTYLLGGPGRRTLKFGIEGLVGWLLSSLEASELRTLGFTVWGLRVSKKRKLRFKRPGPGKELGVAEISVSLGVSGLRSRAIALKGDVGPGWNSLAVGLKSSETLNPKPYM